MKSQQNIASLISEIKTRITLSQCGEMFTVSQKMHILNPKSLG